MVEGTVPIVTKMDSIKPRLERIVGSGNVYSASMQAKKASELPPITNRDYSSGTGILQFTAYSDGQTRRFYVYCISAKYERRAQQELDNLLQNWK